MCELKLSTMELHSVLKSNQANSNQKAFFFFRLRKTFLFELVQVKGGVDPRLWPLVAFYISPVSVSLCEHRGTEKLH